MTRSALVLVSLFAAVACNPHVKGPATPSERDFVLSMTKDEWKCAPEATNVELAGYSRYSLTGCGVKRVFVCNAAMNVPRCWPD